MTPAGVSEAGRPEGSRRAAKHRALRPNEIITSPGDNMRGAAQAGCHRVGRPGMYLASEARSGCSRQREQSQRQHRQDAVDRGRRHRGRGARERNGSFEPKIGVTLAAVLVQSGSGHLPILRRPIRRRPILHRPRASRCPRRSPPPRRGCAPGLADGGGQMVAHRALGQVQPRRDGRRRGAFARRPQHLGLPRGGRRLAADQAVRGQRGVHHPKPGVHPPHRVGQLARRVSFTTNPAAPAWMARRRYPSGQTSAIAAGRAARWGRAGR